MQTKKEEIRNRILAVSERSFIKNGYSDTSLNMIAGACSISKSNIYRYFRSKEEIYETIVGPARQSIMKLIRRFGSKEYAGNYTEDKINEVSDVLAKVMSEYRSSILIMLKSGEKKEQEAIRAAMSDFFVAGCPLRDKEFKKQVASLMMTAYIDILLNCREEDEMRHRLWMLHSYHYLGLTGIKRREI